MLIAHLINTVNYSINDKIFKDTCFKMNYNSREVISSELFNIKVKV